MARKAARITTKTSPRRERTTVNDSIRTVGGVLIEESRSVPLT